MDRTTSAELHAAMRVFKRMPRWLRALIAVTVVVAAAAVVGRYAFGATLAVTTTSDVSDGDTSSIANLIATPGADGAISLREAIIASNNTIGGPHTINFNIGGCGGVCTIAPASALPSVTRAVVLDGWSQPGWTSAPVIELNGTGAGSASGVYITAGGSTVRGLTINRFALDGIRLETGNGNTIQGNWLGVNNAGTASAANDNGIYVSVSGSNTIGGTSASQRNVASGNLRVGLWLSNSSTNTIQGNHFGTNPAGTAAITNNWDGFAIEPGGANNQIGGTAAGARNLISGNTLRGIWLNGATVTSNVIEGNFIGVAADGSSALGNGLEGVHIEGSASNNFIGGTAAGAGNIIAYNTGDGIPMLSGTGNAILRNSMYSNSGLGIDLADNGVTANNGAKTAGQPNLLMDFPVFTSAALAGTNLTVAGYVGSAAGQSVFATSRVEVFIADTTAAGNGEGRTYLGFLTADASGNFSGTLTGVTGITAGTTRITGTATDTSNNTSEFGANFVVAQATFTVSGTVFEDLNYGGGNGRNRATAIAGGGSGRSGARVELYDNAGAFVSSATTDVNGAYSFTSIAAATYTVRVVNETVSSARTGYVASLRAVQTFRTDAASGTATDVYDFVGGQTPSLADAGSNTTNATLASLTTASTTAQSITTVTGTSGTISGVDFGYSFNVVVNVNDSGQGSLRQFIINANALSNTGLAIDARTAGIDHAVFMIANGSASPGLRAALNYFAGGAATIAPVSALPALTTSLVIDAQTQPGWSAAPVIVLDGLNAGAVVDGFTINAGSAILRGFSIIRFTDEGIDINGGGGHLIQGSYVGLRPDGVSAAGNGNDGIGVDGGTTVTIGGAAATQRNVVSGNGRHGVQMTAAGVVTTITGNYIGTTADGSAARGNGNDGVRFDDNDGSNSVVDANLIAGNGEDGITVRPGANGVTITGNRIGTNADGTAALPNTRFGIEIRADAAVIGGSGVAERNLIAGNGDDGIMIGSSASLVSVRGNYIGVNATGTAAIANGDNGISVEGTASGIGIGGVNAGEGNVISGNADDGIDIGNSTASVTIRGNRIGTDAAGTAAVPNGDDGIDVTGGTGHAIGGTASGAGNVISGNGWRGIVLIGSNNIVQGNTIGLGADGSTVVRNGSNGVSIEGGSANLIGGATAGARNVISGNDAAPDLADGIWISNSTSNTIQGNYIGTDSSGTLARPNYNSGIAVWSANNTIGGTNPGEGNLIAFNPTGVIVTQSGATGNRILGNSIFSNTGLGIDLGIDGVTANDGAKTAGQPNLRMDFPVFSAATLAGTSLTVAGFVGTAPNQSTFASSRVEVFIADTTSAGNGEGRTYLGFLTADASGNFSGTLSGVSGVTTGTTRLTATATDTGNNTSEFGPNFMVGQTTFSIAGTVFEDVNYGGGNGRNRATAVAGGGSGRSGARVELYNSSGAFASSTTAVGSGAYTFSAINSGTYTVRVVNETVTSARTGYLSSLRSVQTFRTHAGSGAAVDVYDFVGGQNPSLADVGSNTTNATLASLTTGSATPQSITTATGTTGTISNVDFGYSFNVIVRTANTGQGTLRQFITNANALSNTGLAIDGRTAGIDHAIFMISNGTAAAGLRTANNFFTAGIATISPTSALPTLSQPLVLDAQTQPGWTSAPIIELNGTSAGGGTSGLRVTAGSSIVRGLVINRFGNNGILLDTNGGNLVTGCRIGTNAAGTAAAANGQYGIHINNVPANTIGSSTASQRNLLSGNSNDGLYINGGAAIGNLVLGNFIGTNAAGTAVIGNTSEGITIDGAVNTVIGGTAAGAGNVIGGSTWEGIWLINGATGTTIQGNWIGTDVSGTLNLANNYSGIGIGNTGSSSNNLVGGTVPGAGNVIAFNIGPGIAIDKSATGTAVGNAVLGNSIYSNTGLGIDIDDPYASPSSPGVTPNDAGDADTGGNNRQNFPVLASALVSGGNTTIAGTLNSTANTVFRIEFFSSPTGDPSGYGEGRTYLGFASVTSDGSGNATINTTLTGVSVSIGHVVTATATDAANNTSEFGPNVTAAVGATYSISGIVFEDVNYGGGNGRNRATAMTGGGSARAGARVELYSNAGAFVASATTDVSGAYSFAAVATGSYTVRVVNETVSSVRTGYVSTLRAVQTFRTNASSGSAVDVYDFVGGQSPNLVDAGSNTSNATLASLTVGSTTAQSVTTVAVGAGNVTGVDFGYSFGLVVNSNDAGQGSLRQFIINANALSNTGLAIEGRTAGIEHAVFMISNGTVSAGLRAANNYFAAGAATISPLSALPVIAAPLVLDAQTQPGWTSTAIVMLDGNDLAANALVLGAAAGGSAIRGFIIRDFGGDGIEIQSGSTGNLIAGNFIGRLTAAGADAGAGEGNGGSGIWVNGDGNTIGGTAASQRNVLSGNGAYGVGLFGGSSNVVIGNFIGLTAAGTAALGNSDDGISIRSGSNNNTIGGTAAGTRNVIAGNNTRGILIIDGVTGNSVVGNHIGTDLTGNAAIGGHPFGGVAIANSTGNTIGGATSAHRNLISGNAGIGIIVDTGSSGTLIANNFIGTRADGSAGLANSGHGVLIRANNNTVGGTNAGNTIAFNTGDGIAVTGASTGNALLGNSIHSNSGLGIDLADNGVSANNGSKTAGQPNQLMDFPVFTSASWDGTLLRLRGYVGSAAGQSVFASSRVEIFVSDQDASTYGEGRSYLGFLTTDASGNFAGNLAPAAAVAVNDRITGTATDTGNNTSEFGANFQVRTYQPFRNGSFEDGNLGALTNFGDGSAWIVPAASTAIDYWVVGSVPINAIPGTYWNASHAVRSVELNDSGGAGSIQQTFDTEPGSTYSVFFDYGGSAACGPTRKTLRVSAAGVSQDVTDYLIGGSAQIPPLPSAGRPYEMFYDTALFRFTAASDLTTLRFESLVGGACGPAIDNVRVAVADPFVNGSFETASSSPGGTYITLPAADTSITGWTVGADSIDYAANNPPPSQGSRSVALNGNGAGSVSEAFDTVPGAYLRARFDVATDPAGPLSTTLQAGIPGAAQDYSIASAGTWAWSARSFVFLPTTEATALSFTSQTAGATGPAIDNVVIEAARPFINGSFEDFRFPVRALTDLGIDNPLVRGWVTTGGSLQHWSNATFAPSLGSYSLHLNGGAGAGTICQSFDVDPGTSYDMLYDVAANPALAADQSLQATITSGVATLATRNVTLNPAGVLAGQTRWRTRSISFTATGSSATLCFASTTAGSTGLALDNVRFGVAGTLNTTGQFNAFESSTPANAILGVIKTKIAAQNFTLDIAAIKADKLGYSAFPMSGIKVELIDATNDSAPIDELSNCRASWTSLATLSTTFSLAGSDNGRKAITINTAEIRRNVRLKISYPGTGTPTHVGCSNDNFALRPAAFSGFAATDNDDATAGTARVLANASASGGNVHRAGRPFSVVAQAADGAGATATGYNGVPQLAVVACVTPAGCTAGAVAGSAGTTNGIVTGNAFTYSEAGSISVQLEDAVFADADAGDSTQDERAIRLAAPATIGRFIPDRYRLTTATAPLMAHAICGAGPATQSFTFVGQSFGFATAPIVRATALNAAGTAINNARPAFGTSHVASTFAATGAPVALSGGASASSITAASDALINFGAGSFSFTRDPNTPVSTFAATFTLTVNLSDTSEPGATGAINAEAPLAISGIGFAGGTGNNLHYGRLILRPAYADLRSDLYLPLEVQRHSVLGWQALTETGACVTAAASAFAYSQATGLLNGGAGAANCASRVLNDVTTAGGRASIRLPKPAGGAVPSAMTVTLNTGAAGGNSCSGAATPIPATSAGLPWLAGAAGASPSARVSWGAPRSDYLMLREKYD